MRNKEEKSSREPLFHIVKRPAISTGRAILIRAAAVLLAVLVCSLIVYIGGNADPVRYFKAMFKGAFGTVNLTWSYFYSTAILLAVALAVTPAFKMRFWNIGAEGQVLMGGLAAISCMIYFGDRVPRPILYLAMIVSSIVAGAVWALIPAVFKARWNTNETLFTLMMNYVATQIICFCIDTWVKDGSGTLKPMHALGFPTLYNKWFLIILIVAVITVVLYIYLRFSKHGYELSVVGESENTARYIGINVKKVIIRTMALSGMLCGITGLLICGGMSHTISVGTAGGRGFTAILVSWLAKFNPLMMVLTSMLLVFFQVGALQVSTDLGLDDISDITTSIILFFIIGCEFFINYRLVFRHHKEG